MSRYDDDDDDIVERLRDQRETEERRMRAVYCEHCGADMQDYRPLPDCCPICGETTEPF